MFKHTVTHQHLMAAQVAFVLFGGQVYSTHPRDNKSDFKLLLDTMLANGYLDPLDIEAIRSWLNGISTPPPELQLVGRYNMVTGALSSYGPVNSEANRELVISQLQEVFSNVSEPSEQAPTPTPDGSLNTPTSSQNGSSAPETTNDIPVVMGQVELHLVNDLRVSENRTGGLWDKQVDLPEVGSYWDWEGTPVEVLKIDRGRMPRVYIEYIINWDREGTPVEVLEGERNRMMLAGDYWKEEVELGALKPAEGFPLFSGLLDRYRTEPEDSPWYEEDSQQGRVPELPELESEWLFDKRVRGRVIGVTDKEITDE